MKKVQLNFTEHAAECVNNGTVFRRTTTELYNLYNHPENMHLHIQIVGDESRDIPDLYIDDVTLKTLRYSLSLLSSKALNKCIVWLKAYDGAPLQEFAVVCEPKLADFGVNGYSFRLCHFTEWTPCIDNLSDNTLVCHECEVIEMFDRIKNLI